MVSHMYDQWSHCFKMYHVNINTLYQKKKKNDINVVNWKMVLGKYTYALLLKSICFVKENKLFTPKI